MILALDFKKYVYLHNPAQIQRKAKAAFELNYKRGHLV